MGRIRMLSSAVVVHILTQRTDPGPEIRGTIKRGKELGHTSTITLSLNNRAVLVPLASRLVKDGME